MSNGETTGRVRIQMFGRNYRAIWRLDRGTVEVTSDLGIGRVPLGSLTSAPAIVATEKLREMALQANRGVPAGARIKRARN